MIWKHTTAIKHLNQCRIFPDTTDKEAAVLGALAAVIGRVALPLARNFLWPTAKKIGRDLLVQGAPELLEVATKRKSAKQPLKSTVAKTARKQIGGSLQSRLASGRKIIRRKRRQYTRPPSNQKRKISTRRIISQKPRPKRSRLDFFSRVKNANQYCNTV